MSRRHGVLSILAGSMVLAMVVGRLLGYRFGPRLVVRCRKGHLYTTIWVPGVHLKALDLGLARWQYCPVGSHWSWAVPVREQSLSDEERRQAHRHHDLFVP